ncbi:MAG: hypothetical protein AAB792_00915 [Patescibacteria group bacterium]
MAESELAGGQTNTLEQEIARIERDLAFKRETLEKQKQTGVISEVPHEKETLREIVGEKMTPSATPTPQAVPTTPGAGVPTGSVGIEPPSYMSEELKGKVQELVNTAFSKTIDDAIKQARATNNAALIDAFHDALVDELYNYLVERGKLKKL